MKHDIYDREDGLAHCKVCGGAEITLPTDCPGMRLSPEQEELVSNDMIDYRTDRWLPTCRARKGA